MPTLFNYFLILLALLSHYSIGKRLLKAPNCFTTTVVGISISALVVGILANIAAGLIRYYILLACTVGMVLFVIDIFKRKEKTNFDWKKTFFLLSLGGVLFFLNDPTKVFMEKDSSGKVSLVFDSHHAYYATQSVEMLRANYLNRLRVAAFYPHEWARYNFFQSSSQALAQGFISEPGLLTYFMAQAILIILILLSFGEELVRIGRPSKFKWPFYLLWLVLGFTLFANTLTWNLKTSGFLTAFALVHLVLSLFGRRYREGLIYSIILGASAFRMMPIAALAFLGIWFMFFRKRPLRDWIQTGYDIAFAVLFVVYNYLTLSAPGTTKTFFTRFVFSDSWDYPLITYKMFGYLLSPFFRKIGSERFNEYNFDNFFGKIPLGSPGSYLFIGLVTFLFGYGLHLSWKSSKGPRWVLLGGMAGITILGASLFVAKNLFFLHLICLPYLVMTVFFGYGIGRELSVEEYHDFKKTTCVILFLQIATLFYQYTGADEIPSPVAYVLFDLTLWAFAGIYLLLGASAPLKRKYALGIIICLPMFFRSDWIHMLKAPEVGAGNTRVDISDLLSQDFQRADYVDKTGMALFDYEDPKKNEAYAAILGAHMAYREKHRGFKIWRFFLRQ